MIARALHRGFAVIGARIKINGNDVLIVAGLGAFGVGAWALFPPVALMVIGVFVTLIGIVGARQEPRKPRRGR